jgi:hypothetical protein
LGFVDSVVAAVTCPANTGSASTGSANTGPARSGPTSTAPASTGPAVTSSANTGPATTGPAAFTIRGVGKSLSSFVLIFYRDRRKKSSINCFQVYLH